MQTEYIHGNKELFSFGELEKASNEIFLKIHVYIPVYIIDISERKYNFSNLANPKKSQSTILKYQYNILKFTILLNVLRVLQLKGQL